MTVTAQTRVFMLLGDPVSHSRSPLMQNAAFRAAGVDGVYAALRCSAADVAGLVRGIARSGGGGNITVPHKAVAVEVLERRSEAVVATGVCNTFWLEDDRICGDNTDVAGFLAAAEALLGSCAGVHALIIGAGGAARAVAVALAGAGAAHIAVLNRSVNRARAMADDMARGIPELRIISDSELRREAFDLVVNATSLGLRADDPLPLDLQRTARAGVALDVVCRSGGTAWTRHAAELGILAAEGTTMLVAQGAAAFERWCRVPAPVAAMRAALEDELGAERMA